MAVSQNDKVYSQLALAQIYKKTGVKEKQKERFKYVVLNGKGLNTVRIARNKLGVVDECL